MNPNNTTPKFHNHPYSDFRNTNRTFYYFVPYFNRFNLYCNTLTFNKIQKALILRRKSIAFTM